MNILLTEQDVAQQLHVSLACLRRWRLERGGPPANVWDAKRSLRGSARGGMGEVHADLGIPKKKVFVDLASPRTSAMWE